MSRPIIYLLCLVGVFSTFSLLAQETVPVSRYGISETSGLTVTVTLGGDGARGGSQLLLVFEMNNGSTRKFDLNRSRAEWPGNSERTIEVSVIPSVRYADVTRMGVEWHGSHGDIMQEQDDVDISSLVVKSKSGESLPAFIRNRVVSVGFANNFRLENDQVYWFGAIRPEVRQSGVCTSDASCDDGRFCNGPELCSPGDPAADPRGCVLAAAPCGSGTACNEETDRCAVSCPDNDGDGHLAASCGGDDCDDNDANRYPGNVEIADSNDHDEDCNLNTHGIFRGAASTQICDGRNQVVLVDAQEQFTRARCVTGTVCVQQPNGTGVCMPEPAGYQAPTAAILPSGPQRAPTNEATKKTDKPSTDKILKPSKSTSIKDLLKDGN
ncbi:hypothetical protein QWY82_08055 [Simiduia curdlanivorans]|uniref:Uncharacterized protein n=1 Tax=Simiduia curdlanivorans TaxID=1492769 RepID=A0ABV8V699_9GAMM|nr:hypothetical protein [Simiduia curdlanivorans]MDN3638757.1 hypothetical protein [Simiduia curdlanivorans]